MPTIRYNGQFNADRLLDEIRADPVLGQYINYLSHHAVINDEYVEVDVPDGVDTSPLDALIAAHNPTGPSKGDLLDQVEAGAIDIARNVPGWASWDVDQALQWLDDNLSDSTIDAMVSLADAKVVFKKMMIANRAIVQLLLAIRDKTWPGLRQ